MSVYDEIGGKEAVAVAVDRFYDRVEGDALLAPYFVDTDLPRLRAHMRAFLATANGDGKIDYWDATTGERRESFDWGVGKLYDIAFDAAGDRAATCSVKGDVVVWDVDR